MNEQNEFIKNYLHTEYVGCLKTDHEKCIDLQYEEIGNFVQNAGMFGVAMQLQSDFDDGDIGHPTGKVNEFIKDNFQVDLLNIEQENKINFSLQM